MAKDTAAAVHPSAERRTDGDSTRLLLVSAAEQLVAEHGPEGVSSRQICAAAGQTNNYAVQYHFGSKDGLLDAVFRHRFVRIDSRRSDVLDSALCHDPHPPVRALLDALILPLVDEVLDPASRYVSFLTRVFIHRFTEIPLWFGSAERPVSSVGVLVTEMIRSQLTHLPDTVRDKRIHVVLANCLLALASTEQQIARGTPADLPFDVFVTDLLDTAAHSLTAPFSDAAAAALRAHTTETETT